MLKKMVTKTNIEVFTVLSNEWYARPLEPGPKALGSHPRVVVNDNKGPTAGRRR
jgi:hypothetical protein